LPVAVSEVPGVGEDQECTALSIGQCDLKLVAIAAQILQPYQTFVVVSQIDRVENAGIELRTHFRLGVVRGTPEKVSS
jgi:hypothetical protein